MDKYVGVFTSHMSSRTNMLIILDRRKAKMLMIQVIVFFIREKDESVDLI